MLLDVTELVVRLLQKQRGTLTAAETAASLKEAPCGVTVWWLLSTCGITPFFSPSGHVGNTLDSGTELPRGIGTARDGLLRGRIAEGG